MKTELEALCAEVAKLREEIAALRAERVVIVSPPAPNPPQYWPGYPSYPSYPMLPSPATPYGVPTWCGVSDANRLT